jgi:hypothetical protein
MHYNWNEFINVVKQKDYLINYDANIFHQYFDDKSCERVFNTIISTR